MKNYSLILFSLAGFCAAAQPGQNIDKTIGVVGKYILLRSDLERELKTVKADGVEITDSVRCAVYEELMYQKLLLAQAEKDSVTVKDEQVDYELDRRMNIFIKQFGSEEAFENFYGKSVKDYKEELREDIRDILVAQQMQTKIVGDLKVSPADIRAYYNSLPEDSLPTVNTEVEIAQLLKKPVVSDAAKKAAREKIEGYRKRIVEGGESFSVIATLYTEDPGSAKTGGRYDGITRGVFVPEFEAVAFRLKPGEVSEVFLSSFGYHIVQLIARRGEVIDVRHLLVTAKVSPMDELAAKLKLDSIYEEIKSGQITFCQAAQKYSDDGETKNNCGILANVQEGSTRFEIDALGQYDQDLVFMLDKMKVGDFSKPLLVNNQDGRKSYRLIYLKSRTEPHKINLKDDYQRLQNMALMAKQREIIDAWINKKLKNVYIRISPDYSKCKFTHKWPVNNP